MSSCSWFGPGWPDWPSTPSCDCPPLLLVLLRPRTRGEEASSCCPPPSDSMHSSSSSSSDSPMLMRLDRTSRPGSTEDSSPADSASLRRGWRVRVARVARVLEVRQTLGGAGLASTDEDYQKVWKKVLKFLKGGNYLRSGNFDSPESV